MVRKGVKGEWSYNGKNYFLVKDKKDFHPKDNEIVFIPKDLIQEIISHNRTILLSIKNGRIKKDFLHLITSTRRNLESGELVGTKEAILKKFNKIKFHFDNIKKINYQVLENLYMSVVESSQALFLFSGIKITSPRNIPDRLNKLPKKLSAKLNISFAKEIIKIFKDYEHSKIKLPEGKELDKLITKARRFNEEVQSLL